MKYRYEDSFSKSYRTLPAAYYVHHATREWYPFRDSAGNYLFTNAHNHAEMELLLFTQGNGYVKVGIPGKTLRFEPGDLMIINPFEVHTGAYWKDAEQQKHLCIDFSVLLLEHPLAVIVQRLSNDLLSQGVRCENLISGSDPLYAELRSAFLGMLDAITPAKQNDFRFLSETYRFFDLLHEGNRIHRTDQSPAKNSDTLFVKTALQYINDHYTETISTRDIAGALVYSKEHFCRLFKTCFSVSFTEYLTQYRIEKAKLMLSDHSSSEVAELCGFSSQSNFSRVFRESVGISPSEYKKFLSSD